MKKKLMIVESPAKAKTIKKYLNKEFEVLASYGHVRDLIPTEGAVDPTRNFFMKYEMISRNMKHINAIINALYDTEILYLATDPDREGEAIAWHIYEILRNKDILKNKLIYRVVFHELTKQAIVKAISNPRDISMSLVNAQQARRALDYLVGFNLSPLIWEKIRYGLSAGRVQSPALRMIVSREEEIDKFIKKEYWTIDSNNFFLQHKFTARLYKYNEKKLTQFSIDTSEKAKNIKNNLLKIANNCLTIINIKEKQRIRNPLPPFTTSTLQQEASRKLGYSAKETMINAQKLYEDGFITYMRTDSVNLAMDAITEIRDVIINSFGKQYLSSKKNSYKTKIKNAQEAHEAIRPSSCKIMPDSLVNNDVKKFNLYKLIWNRTIACQMKPTLLNTVSIDLACGQNNENIFRANCWSIIDFGFLVIYNENQFDQSSNKETIFPLVKIGDKVQLIDIKEEQHFTEPPTRYGEASLIQSLEEFGIGRPSTYTMIIDTLLSRKYAILDKKKFAPTDVAKVVNNFLVKYFFNYVDYEFTANLENKLDEVATGQYDFLKLLNEFWIPFKELIDNTAKNVTRNDVTQELLSEICPICGKQLVLKLGKKGKFISCSGYPNCTYTSNILKDNNITSPEIINDRSCPDCSSNLHIKYSKYGKFIGCSNYPNCKFIEPLEKPKSTSIVCPSCENGIILKRKSRYGKYFFSCSEYPKCNYAVWNEPVSIPCPKCGWKIMTIKITKKYGSQKICPQKNCSYYE